MTEQIRETATPKPFASVGSDSAPDLETVMHLMWDRIEGLESDKRSLRRMIAFGLATLLLATGVLGAIFVAHPGRSRNPRDLAVTDGAGRVRARLGVDSQNGATTLQLLDEDGHAQAILAAGAAGPALSFYDRDRARLRIGLASKSPILDVFDAKSGRTTRIDLTTPPPPAAAAVPRRRPGSTSTMVSRDRNPAPRFVDAKGRPCGSGTLGCRRSDS